MRTLRLCSLTVALVLSLPSCSRQAPEQRRTEQQQPALGRRDLVQDEARGGHTLQRHVGKTDEELRERLQRQRDISAASTFTDRTAAEFAVGSCLFEKRRIIEQWEARERHPNPPLDCTAESPVGRSLTRNADHVTPCDNTKVVLKWSGDREYYVLTAYPDCR